MMGGGAGAVYCSFAVSIGGPSLPEGVFGAVGERETLSASGLGPNSCFCIDDWGEVALSGEQVVTVSDAVNPAGVPADCMSNGDPSFAIHSFRTDLLDSDGEGVNETVASVPHFSG